MSKVAAFGFLCFAGGFAGGVGSMKGDWALIILGAFLIIMGAFYKRVFIGSEGE